MAISASQKTAAEETIQILCTATAGRSRRQLSGMFMDLVDRKDWAHYYEVIPEPRCLSQIRSGLEKNRYKDAVDVYTDLSLVFWNALFYNEPDSQIANDATALKVMLETEWKKRPVLPLPRSFSPPPSSAQKVHGMAVDADVPSPSASSTSVPPAAPAPPQKQPSKSSPSLPVQPPASTEAPVLSTMPPQTYRSPTPDIEVDIEGESSDVDVQGGDSEAGPDVARNPADEEIVRQLEKGLPKWPGFSDSGWRHDISSDKYSDIVHAIKTYKDVIGNRLATALESIPDESLIPNLSYSAPLSLKLIESRARHKNYATSKDFDMDMVRLFEKARRWHESGTEPYGRVLILQRLYQALTSHKPPSGPPYTSTQGFAFMVAGPGSSILSNSGVEALALPSGRVSLKLKSIVDQLDYKGWSIKLGDWVHISNPDDPARPIPGQVFRCWTSTDPARMGEPGITVAWYYRPEQTFHPASRTFFENEVFKSGHMGDHPLEDLIEKIAVQFTTRHIRGRPRPPYWYPGWPIYVCDSRYHEQDHTFVRVKNWSSCIPEVMRKNAEYMPIYEFERTVYPRRLLSPFLLKSGKSAVKGPGGIIDGNNATDTDVSSLGRKRTKRGGVDISTPAKGASPAPFGDPSSSTPMVPGYQYQSSQLTHQLIPTTQRPDRSITSVAGPLLGTQIQSEELSPELARYFDRDPETNEVLWFAGPPLDIAMPPAPKHSMEYLHFLAHKRKKALSVTDQMDVDPSSVKRPKHEGQLTMMETMRNIIKELPSSP
ncbi:hypothetical protein ONZ45_g4070 [Pleurotus djamor]|nr:hypothetical protein ONZ45_g4070 [Pleurotus djamor]